MIGVRSDSRFGYPLEISLGVSEPARARYMDVIHDMDYVDGPIGLSVIVTLGRSALHTKQGLCKVTYAHCWMRMCVEFRDEILLRRGECETPRKYNFLKNGKMVILVKIRNNSRSRMTKRTSPLESSHEI